MNQRQKVAISRRAVALDRHGTRTTLGLVASVALTARNREIARVSWKSGAWRHRLGGTFAASPNLMLRGPEDWVASFREQWIGDYLPSAGDVVVDVGAGIGTEVYPLSQLVGNSGRVHAVEAFPAVADCLQLTVDENHLSNVEIHRVAASDEPGQIEIFTDHVAHVANNIFDRTLVTPGASITVAADTLDHLLVRVREIAWLKMNIEGAERQALVGGAQVLARTKHIVVSCHDFVADAGGSESARTSLFVTDLLESAGFVTTRRPRDRRPWVRDQVWGSRL